MTLYTKSEKKARDKAQCFVYGKMGRGGKEEAIFRIWIYAYGVPVSYMSRRCISYIYNGRKNSARDFRAQVL